MNLILHIIKKDILRLRWALLIWTASYLALLLQPQRRLGANTVWDYLLFTAGLMVVVVGIGVVADIIQADHPTRDDAHWRTLPMSSRRVVTAKLLLLGSLFVGLPLVTVWLGNCLSERPAMRELSEYGMLALVLANFVLSLAAAAACTRTVVHCLMLWLGLSLGTMALAGVLSRFAQVLSPHALFRMPLDKVQVITTLSILVGLAVILNQYLRRKLGTSVVLYLFGAVGVACAGVFWGYFYLYQG
ncbi:MAG: hypothetical protein QG602_2282 [Verrucomicrobiota bacterium]|nr:hypothetical protein [Verrucomicrobiota bacterium]